MPLNMNTVGTGTGISSGGTGNTVNALITKTLVADSADIDVVNFNMASSYIATYRTDGAYGFVGRDNTYYYNWHSGDIYRTKLIINSNNTCNPETNVRTQVTTSNVSSPILVCMVNGLIYMVDSSTNILYRLNTSTNALTQIMSSAFPSSFINRRNAYLFARSRRHINGSNYMLYTSTDTWYGNSDPWYFMMVKDPISSNASIAVQTTVGYTFTSGSYMKTGIERLNSNNTILGIYDVQESTEYIDVYIANIYASGASYSDDSQYDRAQYTTFDETFDTLLFRFGKETGVLTTTLLNSTKVATGKYGQEFLVNPLSYPTDNTLLVLSISRQSTYEDSSSSTIYFYYYGAAYTVQMEKTPVVKMVTSSLAAGDSMPFGSDAYKYLNDLVYYPCSYAPVFLAHRYSSDSGSETLVIPVSIGIDTTNTVSEFTMSIYLCKGDVVKSDSKISSYTLNGHTTNVNNTSLTVSTNGKYTIHVSCTGDVYPDCVVYTNDGSILGCDIEFVDDTHITGYFNKGMTINGVKTTSSGYQTITGTFNGRVSISK